jgi:hypothetical protein
VAGSSSLAKLLFTIIIGLAFHSGASADSAARGAFAARPSGEWVATGRVLVAHGVVERTTGEVLKRRWFFEKSCGAVTCPTLFERTTSGAEIEKSRLSFEPGYYAAAFGPISDGCEERPGWFASFDGRFRIWWSADRSRLLAEETGRFAGGHGCPLAVERIRWVATRHYGGSSEGADEVL